MVTLLDDISIPHLLGLSSFSLYLILFSVLVSRGHPRCVHVQRPGNLDETTCTSCLSESAPAALSSVNVPRRASILNLAWTNSTQAICAIHFLYSMQYFCSEHTDIPFHAPGFEDRGRSDYRIYRIPPHCISFNLQGQHAEVYFLLSVYNIVVTLPVYQVEVPLL